MRAYVLEITHPRRVRRREMIAPYETVILNRRGQIDFGHPVGITIPSLVISSAQGSPPTVVGLLGAMPEVNGTAVEAPAGDHKKQLSAGDILRWRDFVVTVGMTRQPDEAEWAMVEAARASDAALLVYADWLESIGDADCAEWARLSLTPTERRGKLQELANRIGSDFRALVARGPVERCEKSCDRRWETLQLTDEPWRRNCTTCFNTVRWCADVEAGRTLRTGAVVIDPAEPRRQYDLVVPPNLTIG